MTIKEIIKTKEMIYRYKCPYCFEDLGIIEDANYYFGSVVGDDCPNCNKVFAFDEAEL